MSTASEELASPQSQLRIDEVSLGKYLSARLPGDAASLEVRQFRGGQSNPTFLMTYGSRRYVLRKKPAGVLLATAHMIEREYRVMTALAESDVPVPRTYLLCEDPDVIGTPFFVMDYLEGRLFWDARLPELRPEQRRACFHEKNRVLAALHSVDPIAVGLGDYGRAGNYMVRQIRRWSSQYEASKTEELVSMNALMTWLPANVPDDDTTRIVHGDFRFDNMMFHATEARVLGVLDWELSTLGHPLADLAYDCLQYYSPGDDGRTLAQVAGSDSGIPTEREYIDLYCRRTGRSGIDHWTFYIAFSMFRLASIVQGVYKRGLDGNASSPEALERKDACRMLADRAWKRIEADRNAS
jgi:aminoglycoside phosphotransferase (APT) family kinase protein